MRSVSRVAIMLLFRNGSEGGRTAVIALDAVEVKVGVERGRQRTPTRRLCLALVCIQPITSYSIAYAVLYSSSTLLLQSKSFRLSALPLLHLARLATSHLLPRYCLHRSTCISSLLMRSYTTTTLRTCLARGKYDTKVIAPRRYVVAPRIPKGNLFISKRVNGRDKQDVFPPLAP